MDGLSKRPALMKPVKPWLPACRAYALEGTEEKPALLRKYKLYKGIIVSIRYFECHFSK